MPSNFARPVRRTVRIGTLMPTPRVSVPLMTFSRPCWDSFSTSRRYFGSISAWWMPMPFRSSRDRVLPKVVVNRKSPMASTMRALSSSVMRALLVNAWARSTASRCVKCTM